jgi:acyl-coenzyme A synthetase/AMP-(fatty) acid ligase
VVFIRKNNRTQSHELGMLRNARFMICGPYMIEVLLRLHEKLNNLLHPKLKILSLGSYLPPTIIKLMYARHQIPVLNFYGLTETFGFALADKTINTQDCLPLPCANVSLSLLPIQGEEKLFKLEIISPNLFLGYLGEHLEKKMIFNTEDLVLRHENGQLQFMGRASGAAKAKNGEWIFPLQLETWLRSQKDIEDAVVKVNPPLTTEYLLSIFISSHKNLSDLTYNLTQKIMATFGHDYHSITWHQANITRSIEGKIEKITPSTVLKENFDA